MDSKLLELEQVETRLLKESQVINLSLDDNFEEKFSTRSNFILQSAAVSEFGGPDKSALMLSYQVDPIFDSEVRVVPTVSNGSSDKLGLFVRVAGSALNDELFYLVLQNIRRQMQIQGIMVKGAGDELWIRVGQKAIDLGFSFGLLGEILSKRLMREFPEIEAVRIIFATGDSPCYDSLQKVARAYTALQEKLKAEVWKSRGYDFKDCHVLGHCGQCADKKLCANVRKMDRLSQEHRVTFKNKKEEAQ